MKGQQVVATFLFEGDVPPERATQLILDRAEYCEWPGEPSATITDVRAATPGIAAALEEAAASIDRAAREIEANYLVPGRTSQHTTQLFAMCAVIQDKLTSMAEEARVLFPESNKGGAS